MRVRKCAQCWRPPRPPFTCCADAPCAFATTRVRRDHADHRRGGAQNGVPAPRACSEARCANASAQTQRPAAARRGAMPYAGSAHRDTREHYARQRRCRPPDTTADATSVRHHSPRYDHDVTPADRCAARAAKARSVRWCRQNKPQNAGKEHRGCAVRAHPENAPRQDAAQRAAR